MTNDDDDTGALRTRVQLESPPSYLLSEDVTKKTTTSQFPF